jgi:type IV pilus assembly protein PilV
MHQTGELKMDDKRQRRAGRGKRGRKGQAGVALLEALIAILVFSLGILTVIGIQATSIRMAADAQLRTRAALLANRLIGQMWVSGLDIGQLKADFESPNGPDTGYGKWLKEVRAYENGPGLPGVDDGTGDECGTSTAPTVTGDSTAGAKHGRVVVKLCWRTPSMDAGQFHQHTVTTQISRNP